MLTAIVILLVLILLCMVPVLGEAVALSLVIAWLVAFGLAMVGAAGAAIFLLVALAT